MIDYYELLPPGEFHDYFKETNPKLTIDQKIAIVNKSWCPIEKKITTLTLLSNDSKKKKDKTKTNNNLSVYHLINDIISSNNEDLVFILFAYYIEPDLYATVNYDLSRRDRFAGVFQTYDSMVNFVKKNSDDESSWIYKVVNLSNTDIVLENLYLDNDGNTVYAESLDWIIDKHGLDFFPETRINHGFPFKNDEKVKIEMPGMYEPIYGYLESSLYEPTGEYHNFFTPEDHDKEYLFTQEIQNFSFMANRDVPPVAYWISRA